MSDHEPAARPENDWVSFRPGPLIAVGAVAAGGSSVVSLLDGARWQIPTMLGITAVLWLLYLFTHKVMVDRDGVVIRLSFLGRRYYPAVELTERVTPRHIRIHHHDRRRAVLRLPKSPSRWKFPDLHVTPSHIDDPTSTIRQLLAPSNDANPDRNSSP